MTFETMPEVIRFRARLARVLNEYPLDSADKTAIQDYATAQLHQRLLQMRASESVPSGADSWHAVEAAIARVNE